MSSTTRPIIYGVPFSQPVRAVMWLMLYKQTPFEMVLINPGSKGETGSRNPAYLAKNPGGTIPTIEEPDTGHVLSEAHAIMCYLSNTHGWEDVYPTDISNAPRSTGICTITTAMSATPPSAWSHQRSVRIWIFRTSFNRLPARHMTTALRSLESGWLAESRYLTGEQLTWPTLPPTWRSGSCNRALPTSSISTPSPTCDVG